MTVEQLPSSYQFGKVVGRIVHAVADTPEDVDAYPEARPAQGTVTFDPAEKQRIVATPEGSVIVMHEPVTCSLSSTGRIIDAEGNVGIWLVQGVWRVSFSVQGGSVEPLDIDVTSAHTDETPLDLVTVVPYTPPTGTTVITMVVPSGGQPGQALTPVAPGSVEAKWVDLQAGPSAYEIAVDQGFVGTEAEWLASLKGEPGADSTVPGNPGDSAYQIAVSQGFVGTEAEWLASLKGEPGASGVPGSLDDLSDVDTTGATEGQALVKTLTGWGPGTIEGGGGFDTGDAFPLVLVNPGYYLPINGYGHTTWSFSSNAPNSYGVAPITPIIVTAPVVVDAYGFMIQTASEHSSPVSLHPTVYGSDGAFFADLPLGPIMTTGFKEVELSTNLTMSPGIYYIVSRLESEDGSTMTGANPIFYGISVVYGISITQNLHTNNYNNRPYVSVGQGYPGQRDYAYPAANITDLNIQKVPQSGSPLRISLRRAS